jgi:hypothetical protein
MRTVLRLFLVISLVGGAGSFRQANAAPAASRLIYADGLAQGWANWSWTSVDLGSNAQAYHGSYSIRVTYSAWGGLYLHHPGLDVSGYTALRFYVHGGSAGGQHVNLIALTNSGGDDVQGPAVPMPLPAAGAWQEVRIPLADLDAAGKVLTGIMWQDSSGGSQPVMYFDEISLVDDAHPAGPQLSAPYLHPRAALAGDFHGVVVRATANDPQGLADIVSVTLDAGALGAGTVALKDDGWSNDGAAGDGVFGAVFNIASGVLPGEKALFVSASDQAGHQSTLELGTLTVLGTAGGNILADMPARIGWGSNAWSEDPDQDWQVQSGVPWDYVYQYITYEWYTQGWGGNFVTRFVEQAWDKGYIPMVVVYMVLGVPNNCGEGGSCYAQKLQNATTVRNYLAALAEAARQAQGSDPVIFNLEPDFYGFMQQLSNSGSAPSGVHPDDPSSYPVALNVAGYPNNLAGFGRRMVDVVHATAPNALVAPMASMWATNFDPMSTTPSDAMQIGQRTAAFIDAMGGAQSDLIIVEWSDRDAGRGIRPWWDDTDQELPRPTRALLWENALSRASGKRLLLWQVPVGNMSLNNTCQHYQDNRAAYAFSHPRELFDAGVAGLLFGGGDSCSTGVDTDGGFVAAQGAIAYTPPDPPVGLASGAIVNNLVPMRWIESDEPDLWGYQLRYQVAGGGQVYNYDVGRRNAARLVLLSPGDWSIQVVAYDAMGLTSSPSTAVQVTISSALPLTFLPFVRH